MHRNTSETVVKFILLILTFISALFFTAANVNSAGGFYHWLVLFLVAGGCYFILSNIFERWLPESNKNNEKKLLSAIQLDLFESSDYPAFFVNPNNMEVLELNSVAQTMFAENLLEHNMRLACLFNHSEFGEVSQWLQAVKEHQNFTKTAVQVLVVDSLNRERLTTAQLTALVVTDTLSNEHDYKCLLRIEVSGTKHKPALSPAKEKSRFHSLKYDGGLAYWELHLSTNTLYFSRKVAEILAFDHTFQSPAFMTNLKSIVDTTVFELVRSKIETNLAKGNQKNTYAAQKMMINRVGEQKFVQVNAAYVEEENVIEGTFYDLTSIKAKEVKLRQQDQQLNQLIDSIPESIFVFQNSKVVFWNHAAKRQFQISPEQRISLSKIVSENDKHVIHSRIKYLLAGKKSNYGFTYVNMKRFDGKLFEAELAMNLIIYEGVESIQFVIRDLTDVLRVKNALTRANNRLSALSSRTLELIEKERKQIAGELHDDVGQSLTAMILGLNWLSRRIETPKLANKIEDLHQIASQCLDTVRNISLLLRPSQLDSLGFSAAIKWQMERLFSFSGITFNLDDKNFSELSDKQAEIVGFRVIQESLTNIVKHSEAKNVNVTLKSDEEILSINVNDDGIGFDVNEQSESVGLINMKERVELANGEFTITSKPFLGTDIKVEIPLLNSSKRLNFKNHRKEM